MIPTLLVPGLVAGLFPKGWLFVIVAGVGWPLLLVATDVFHGIDLVLGAGALGAANGALGVFVGRGLRLFAKTQLTPGREQSRAPFRMR